MAHAQYLTYEEYREYGGALSPAAFAPLELRCRKRIDYLTASRVQRMREVPQAVRLCMVSLIGMESKVGIEAQAENPVVTSFSTDGYSESYGNAYTEESASGAMDRLVFTSLYGELDDFGVPLLYLGVRG